MSLTFRTCQKKKTNVYDGSETLKNEKNSGEKHVFDPAKWLCYTLLKKTKLKSTYVKFAALPKNEVEKFFNSFFIAFFFNFLCEWSKSWCFDRFATSNEKMNSIIKENKFKLCMGDFFRYSNTYSKEWTKTSFLWYAR